MKENKKYTKPEWPSDRINHPYDEAELMREAEHKNWQLMWIIRNACEVADFTLVGRVTLRDNKTGRVFK